MSKVVTTSNKLSQNITNRKQKALETKNKILTTAIQLIKERGYNNVTIDEISQQCGVTKGAFYHHFNSKEAIIHNVYINSDTKVLKKLPSILSKAHSLEQILEITLSFAEATQYRGVDMLKQFFRIVFESDDNQFLYNPNNREVLQLELKILEKGQENGEKDIHKK